MKLRIAERVSPEVVREYPELPWLVVQLLSNRGVAGTETIHEYLHPEYERLHDPYLFGDMERAVERVYLAIERNEVIGIHGDYDADGVAGALIIQTALSAIGGKTEVYLPHREKEGYGLKLPGVDFFHAAGCKLIITCDCGISDKEAIAEARQRGIDVIITDHHTVPPELPDAYAILHPQRIGEQYPWKQLAGGGVAFKFAQALLRSDRNALSGEAREGTEKWLLDLAAISTIADMVPLRGENRILAKWGLMVLSKTRRPGLQRLYALARVTPAAITSETVSFQIAPRINAAGRMDHARHAYTLLAATDETEAAVLAEQLEQHNKARQRQSEKIFLEAKKKLDLSKPVVTLYEETWPAGLLGLIAGKLVKEVSRPVFLLCREGSNIVASGRGIPGINILDSLHGVRDFLISHGGHSAACGFRLEETNLDPVIEGIHSHFASAQLTEPTDQSLEVDAEIKLEDINAQLVDYIRKFEPFGMENSEPIFYSRNVEVVERRAVGKTGSHLKLGLQQGDARRTAIAFNAAATLTPTIRYLDIAYVVRESYWKGVRRVELVFRYSAPHAA